MRFVGQQWNLKNCEPLELKLELKLLVRSIVRQAVLLLVLLLISCAFAFPQRGGIASSGRRVAASDPQFWPRRNQVDPAEQRMERERDKRLNKERQASIQRDTDKLLSLATELKQYVDKTNENVLSLEVMKKAEQIEKLAHQVKENMKHRP